MRGMTYSITIGERVALHRRRRGLSQEVLAGLVGRTEDWLSKIENNRADSTGCPSSASWPMRSTLLSVTSLASLRRSNGAARTVRVPFSHSERH